MTTYYVSDSDGSDSDTGLTEALAWKTLAKVNGTTLVAGDIVLLKRGDTWWLQTLSMTDTASSGNPIIVDVYGAGAKPIIQGARLSTESGLRWTASGSGTNEYYINDTGSDPSLTEMFRLFDLSDKAEYVEGATIGALADKE